MESQSQSTTTSDTKAPCSSSSSILTQTTSKKKIHTFDCAICCESLSKPGPPLECFTFGKVLIHFDDLTYLERQILYRDFLLSDQCFTNGQFDCDKILVTRCGHIFHSGCIREWYFMRRMERYPKCPFCNQVTNYEECRILHPLAQDDNDDDDSTEETGGYKTFNETEYSDISCASSSWPSDEERDGTMTSEGEDSDDDGTVVISRDNELGLPNMDHERECHVCRAKASRQHRKFTDLLETAVKYNLMHMITLLWVIGKICQRYKMRKENFQADLERLTDYVEDEDLSDFDSADSLVPLGYDFMGTLVVVGWIIFLCEYIICGTSKESRGVL